ncbi:porin family protein [Parvularcula flava]|uniref:P44/Msp2 family outer membrane protein n=1 Tax=Aquisalinus luteolus TaxID=1566827 RepID=A0A8J3ER90_9PROT|nr:outer membrane beta-barrel protein [Aquisalinus luteolus]NHK28210.1 porin family protein [Aquisalinus luteolus]GGH97795.1 P44/Msp2 family outer membrane protein [Aquisalinus luteolus]
MIYRRSLGIGALVAVAGFATSAAAQDYYVSGTFGVNSQENSDNSGEFTRPFFITGTGTALDGASLPEGTEVGWETDFDDGYTFGAAVGKDYGMFRLEAELAYAKNDVEAHRMVEAAGMNIMPVDAAVLIQGQTSPLGASVGQIVADGQGDISTTYILANAYLDFENNTRLTPYVGAGLGTAFVDVDYSPSGVAIASDSGNVFAYQFIGGLDFALNDTSSLLTNVRYRGTGDVDVEVDLFPAELQVQNSSYVLEAGYRYKF